MTARVTPWAEYPPLKKAQARLAELDAQIAAANSEVAAAREGRPEPFRIDDLQTSVLIGKAEQAELDAVQKVLAHSEAAERVAVQKLGEPQRLRERLAAGIPTLEAEAKQKAEAEWLRLHRPAIRKVLDAIRPAVEAQKAARELYAEAAKQYGDTGLHTFSDSFFLLDFHLSNLCPDDPGACLVIGSMEAYAKGEAVKRTF